jgi:hypothetical protein
MKNLELWIILLCLGAAPPSLGTTDSRSKFRFRRNTIEVGGLGLNKFSGGVRTTGFLRVIAVALQ